MSEIAFGCGAFPGVRGHALKSVSKRQSTSSDSSIRQTLRCSRVLVVNAPGGGHGPIGAYLSGLLLKAGNTVRLLHSGDTIPASIAGLYSELEGNDGFSVEACSIPSSLPETYDIVYDNYSKSADDAALALQQAKSGAQVHYVSSAGAYKEPPNGMAPSLVGDPASGATIDVENLLSAAGAPGASFRPIYIYGRGSSKRAYLDFFFDRIVRNRTIYIPGTGAELTSLTDTRDVASMLAAISNKKVSPGSRPIYNAVSSRAVSFDGVAELCAAAVGKDNVKIRHYDPAWAEANVPGYKLKKVFTFRVRHFFADSSSAVSDLDWSPEYSGTLEGLRATIREAYEEYKELGLDKTDVNFSTDDAIAAAIA